MKYTRTEAGVIEVKGCTSCPHMEMREKTMHCMHLKLYAGNKWKPSEKKLVAHWMGSYHASCPLASEPKMVPEFPKGAAK